MRIVDKNRDNYVIISVMKLEFMPPSEVDLIIHKYIRQYPDAEVETLFEEDNVFDSKLYEDNEVICYCCGAVEKNPSTHRVKKKNNYIVFKCRKCEYIQNKDTLLRNNIKWKQDNLEKFKKYQEKYAKDNVEKIRVKNKRWQTSERGRAKMTMYCSRRRAAKLKRTPAWADLEKIEDFYSEARRLTVETGNKWSVDHIIPLRGKFVSGLHTQDNLQVILLSENVRKSNKFEID